MLLARSLGLASVVLSTAVSSSAFAGAPCLPKAWFPKESPPQLDLGLVAGAPVLCAHADYEHAGLLGCFAVDPKTGALSDAPATALPGHSLRGKVDAKGCLEGYCAAPKASADELLLYATSTDGAHAVILRDGILYVFDAKTKKQVRAIALRDDKAPDDTNVGNDPYELLYVGNAIYVAGTDAGPYQAVWAYKDDGKRTGLVKDDGADAGGFSVFAGGVNVLDDKHVALASAGLQELLVVTGSDGVRALTARAVKPGACKPEELEYLGEGSDVSKACKKVLAKSYQPFAGLDPVALPAGGYLAALGGKLRGSLAILDAKTLVENKRLKLKVCAK